MVSLPRKVGGEIFFLKKMDIEPSEKGFGRGELKERVTQGVAWSMAEKVGSMLLQVVVSLVLLRLLTPKDLGVMAILTAVSAIAVVLVDSGFSQTLIRKSQPTQGDFKAVFVFNLSVATLLYLLTVAVAPWAADYYRMEELSDLALVFFLLLPVNALCSVQNVLLVRQFRFALLSKVTFFASFVSDVVAIAMALTGWGVWSLVVQRFLQIAVKAVLLWFYSSWRPSGKGDYRSLMKMVPFSMSLMTTDLLTTFYNKIPQFFLGRLYPAHTLGSFDQAIKLKDQPVIAAVQSVQAVTFPALSKIKDDVSRFTESYRQLLMIVAYVMFPIMFGMSAVAEELFEAVLGEEWMPTVPFFEVICLAGLFYPLGVVAFNVMKVKSDGGIIFKSEVFKKVVMTLIFAVTIPWSVEAVVWGLVVIAWTEMMVNLWASFRFSDLNWGGFLRTILPVLLLSLTMYFVTMGVGELLPYAAWLQLIVKILVGVVTYLLLSWAFGMEAFHEMVSIARRQLFRR